LIDKPRKTEIHRKEEGYCCIGAKRGWCGHVHDKATTAFDCSMSDIAYSRDVLDVVSDRRVYDLKVLKRDNGEPLVISSSKPITIIEIATDPKQIFIPFHKQMRKAVFDGIKSMTSRSKCYGRPGDTFPVDDREYILEWVLPFRQGFIARFLYRQEGFNSPEEFMAFLPVIHHGHPFDPHKIVFLHKFLPSFSTADRLK
jgi:sRNA-binding carbon storage regulator CsrA